MTVPEGWKLSKLSDIATEVKDRVSPKGIEPIDYIGLEHIEPNCKRITVTGSSTDVVSQKTKFINDDVLFGKLRPYLHKVVLSDREGICSTDILGVCPRIGIEQKIFIIEIEFSQI